MGTGVTWKVGVAARVVLAPLALVGVLLVFYAQEVISYSLLRLYHERLVPFLVGVFEWVLRHLAF